MSEGELKKRIRENALELSHGDMASGAIGGDYNYIRIGVLKDILENAAKEFPKPRLGLCDYAEPEKGKCWHIPSYKDVEKWFKKEFGDDKK